MSADNGIYILKTKDNQYRVAHLSAIENITFSAFDVESKKIVPTRIVEVWGNCKFTRNEDKALDIAFKWKRKLPICEYGITVIKIDKTWKQILEDSKEYAKKEIAWIKIHNQEKLWDINELQKIADGYYMHMFGYKTRK